jgi:hypothetical protein
LRQPLGTSSRYNMQYRRCCIEIKICQFMEPA